LRKKSDLTQEQLAEQLGVSPQSISKWETNAAYPDITMFPILANFYGVTTDELLGVDLTKSEEKISNYINEILELYHGWKHKEMVELCRKACHEFPAV
jgi:transcriptional regulator with XRE-family HTH domain